MGEQAYMKPGDALKCEDFAEALMDISYFDDRMADDYWTESFNTDRYYDALVAEAVARGITLVDMADWDYDAFFSNAYHCNPDKGLS